MYFECCLFGFFKETLEQTIFLDDVDVEAFECYLNIAHGWFFEMKVRGVRVVPPESSTTKSTPSCKVLGWKAVWKFPR